MKNIKKVVIGSSDYTRKQMSDGSIGWSIGTSPTDFLKTIKEYESNGYTVKFETSFLRRIFGSGIYKVVAYK